MASPVDMIIIVLTIALPLLFFFRNSLPFIGGRSRDGADGASAGSLKRSSTGMDEGDDPRDFVDKMARGVSVLCARARGAVDADSLCV